MENLTDFTEIGRIVLENIKKTRQEKGLTEETAALKSGINREQLEKLESGNLTFLPPPYVIALLRKYALALGIYDETLFKQLKESADIPAPKSPRKRTAQSQKSADRTENKNRNLYASITAIIVIAAAALWMIFGRPIQQPPPMEASLPDVSELPAAYTSPTAPPPPSTQAAAEAKETISPAPAEPEKTAVAAEDEEQAASLSKSEQEHSNETTVQKGCFTLSIDRAAMEPGKEIDILTPATGSIYYFSDITMPSGEPIWHEWELNGKPVDRISVGTPTGNRWRCWSRKSTGNRQEGKWTVRVVQGEGVEIHSDSIAVTIPPEEGQ